MAILSDKIQLFTTAIFNDYKNEKPIPILYNRAIIEPIQIDRQGFKFCLVAHNTVVVTVKRDDQKILDFDSSIEKMGSTNFSILTLRNPLAEGERLEVECLGKTGEDGGLIIYAGDVLADFLNTFNINIESSRLRNFISETRSKNLIWSGVIEDKGKTIKSYIDDMITKSGCIFSNILTDVARIYPGPRENYYPIKQSLTELDVVNLSVSQKASNIFNALSMSYHYNFASNQPQKFLKVINKTHVRDHGEKNIDVQARWINDQNTAIDVCTRTLQYLSRKKWDLFFTTRVETELETGDYFNIDHPFIPSDTHVLGFVKSHNIDNSNNLILVAEFFIDSLPVIDIERITNQGEIGVIAPLTIEFSAGLLTITVINDNNEAVIGAECILDGDIAKRTNSAGQVVFNDVDKGAHSIIIEAPGLASIEYEFTL